MMLWKTLPGGVRRSGDGGVLTVFGDVDGSLSERRRGGQEGQGEEEQEGRGARPPTARPPTP